jgi:hypothetical protein
VKGGRAIYTEARMIALYGRDAKGWSRVLCAGSRITSDAHALQILQRTEAIVRMHKPLYTQLVADAARFTIESD